MHICFSCVKISLEKMINAQGGLEMALLLVRIDEVASLPLNEFYDYNGKCYAFAGDREQSGDTGFPLEDF